MKVSATLTIDYFNKEKTPSKIVEIDPHAEKMPKVGLCPKCGGMRLRKKHLNKIIERRVCPICKADFIAAVTFQVAVDLGWTIWT